MPSPPGGSHPLIPTITQVDSIEGGNVFVNKYSTPNPAQNLNPAQNVKTMFVGNYFSCFLIGWEVLIIILFATTTKLSDAYMPSAGSEATSTTKGATYAMFQDTHIMLAVGFGFLYTLYRRYAWTGVGLNFLLCAISFQWAILCVGFFDEIRFVMTGLHTEFQPISLSLESVILGDYAVCL